MGSLAYFTQLVTELINKVNLVLTNGKKIDELESQETLVPTSKIHVSNDGDSESITVQQIINAATNGDNDQILVIGELSLVDNDLTIPAGVSWKINNVIYSIGTDTVINIPFADTDLNRKDVIIANEDGEIIRLAGTETAGGIVVAPTVPANTLLITEIDVSDSTVGDPTDPVIGLSDFKGYWDANTNTPALVNGVGQAGDYLIVSVPGEQFSYNFAELDRVEYNGSIWFKSVDNNQTPDLSNYYDKDEVNALVVGLWDDRGSYDASSNAFPSTGGSGAAGAILKGDIWTISVAGTLPSSQPVEIGDTVRALVDTPGTTASNWAIQQNNIGYVPENTVNKVTTMTGNTTSNIVFLTAKAIYDWGTGLFQEILTAVNFGAFINGLTSKTTPVDADSISLVDTGDSNKQKKVSLTNFKAFLKTYFDTLYHPRQALYFYAGSASTTFSADQKNMHVSRFNTGSLYGSFGLTLGNGVTESGGVIDMTYLGDVGIPMIVPFNCIVEKVIIRYSRNAAESGANTNIMFRMMSDTVYNLNNQMICDYNLTGTTALGNAEVSVSATILSHSTITEGGGIKFCVRTNNATAQQFNIFRIMVIVKKV